MHRNIFVEDIERDANGRPLGATGIAEMAGIEARWTAEILPGQTLWHARLIEGQFVGDDVDLADLFTCNPPLGDSVGSEVRRVTRAS